MKYIKSYKELKDLNEWDKPMILNNDINVSEELKYHLDNNLPIGKSVFRYGSESFFKLIEEVKILFDDNSISLNNNDIAILNDIDDTILLENDNIHLGMIYEDLNISESEYKGRDVVLNKPKRGGSKKFYVFVKDPKSGKIKKVSFGAKDGGGNLAVKLKDPKAKKSFADRHNCEEKNDKTTPGYWSCRLPRYAKLLGLSGSGKWW